MEPTVIIALLSALLVATHIGMATARPRAWLVSGLGENRFVLLYSAIASAEFALLIAYYAAHRFEGPAGPRLSAIPPIRWALMAVIAAGIALSGGSLVGFPDSPYPALGHNFREPYGLERITRHGFFVGTFMLGAGHALLASHINGTIMFSSLALLAVAGARHQDSKLLRRGGEAYRHFLETTSMVPFTAIIEGRQRIVWREIPIRGLVIAFAAAMALRMVHDWIFAYGGLFVIAGVLGGVGIIALVSLLQARSKSRRTRVQETHAAAESGRSTTGVARMN